MFTTPHAARPGLVQRRGGLLLPTHADYLFPQGAFPATLSPIHLHRILSLRNEALYERSH
jgi:hypothetical protein